MRNKSTLVTSAKGGRASAPPRTSWHRFITGGSPCIPCGLRRYDYREAGPLEVTVPKVPPVMPPSLGGGATG